MILNENEYYSAEDFYETKEYYTLIMPINTSYQQGVDLFLQKLYELKDESVFNRFVYENKISAEYSYFDFDFPIIYLEIDITIQLTFNYKTNLINRIEPCSKVLTKKFTFYVKQTYFEDKKKWEIHSESYHTINKKNFFYGFNYIYVWCYNNQLYMKKTWTWNENDNTVDYLFFTDTPSLKFIQDNFIKILTVDNVDYSGEKTELFYKFMLFSKYKTEIMNYYIDTFYIENNIMYFVLMNKYKV